jgi:hypothetical protein
LPCLFFFSPKTPALNISPVRYDYRFPPPKRVRALYVQRIARGRAAGCGVVQHANETRQPAVIQAQAQYAQHAAMQVQRRCRCYCTARQKFANKIQQRLRSRSAMPVEAEHSPLPIPIDHWFRRTGPFRNHHQPRGQWPCAAHPRLRKFMMRILALLAILVITTAISPRRFPFAFAMIPCLQKILCNSK